MREAAAMADVVVLNRELDGIKFPDMLTLVGDMVLKTGKPIVAVPESMRRLDAFGPALIAWDGSKEAEAALRAAVPLLVHASAVTILEIDDGSLKQPASEAAAYLSRHGIRSVVQRDASLIDLPSTMILDAVDVLGAGYLVMGGFGHARFVEATLGGVTRRMLKECPVPIFLAH
jgi:nucleotide-binding universal stress UspA family protein